MSDEKIGAINTEVKDTGVNKNASLPPRKDTNQEAKSSESGKETEKAGNKQDMTSLSKELQNEKIKPPDTQIYDKKITGNESLNSLKANFMKKLNEPKETGSNQPPKSSIDESKLKPAEDKRAQEAINKDYRELRREVKEGRERAEKMVQELGPGEHKLVDEKGNPTGSAKISKDKHGNNTVSLKRKDGSTDTTSYNEKKHEDCKIESKDSAGIKQEKELKDNKARHTFDAGKSGPITHNYSRGENGKVSREISGPDTMPKGNKRAEEIKQEQKNLKDDIRAGVSKAKILTGKLGPGEHQLTDSKGNPTGTAKISKDNDGKVSVSIEKKDGSSEVISYNEKKLGDGKVETKSPTGMKQVKECEGSTYKHTYDTSGRPGPITNKYICDEKGCSIKEVTGPEKFPGEQPVMLERTKINSDGSTDTTVFVTKDKDGKPVYKKILENNNK